MNNGTGINLALDKLTADPGKVLIDLRESLEGYHIIGFAQPDGTHASFVFRRATEASEGDMVIALEHEDRVRPVARALLVVRRDPRVGPTLEVRWTPGLLRPQLWNAAKLAVERVALEDVPVLSRDVEHTLLEAVLTARTRRRQPAAVAASE